MKIVDKIVLEKKLAGACTPEGILVVFKVRREADLFKKSGIYIECSKNSKVSKVTKTQYEFN